MIGREVVHNMSNELGAVGPEPRTAGGCSWSTLHLGRCRPSQQGEDALRLSACSETGFA